jgi:hypothetical protein
VYSGAYCAPVGNAEGQVVASVDLMDLEPRLGATLAQRERQFRDYPGKLRTVSNAAQRSSLQQQQ